VVNSLPLIDRGFEHFIEVFKDNIDTNSLSTLELVLTCKLAEVVAGLRVECVELARRKVLFKERVEVGAEESYVEHSFGVFEGFLDFV